MRSGVVSRRRAVPRSNGWRRFASIAIGLVVFIGIAGLLARDAIERAWLQHTLTGALGADVQLGALHHRDDLTVLDSVRITTPRGTVLSADTVTYHVDGNAWDITPVALHLTLPRATLGDSDLPRALAAAHDLNVAHLTLHLRNAGIDVTNADTKAVEIAGITGDLHAGDKLSYAFDATWIDDVAATGAYPITAHADTVDGATLHTLTADTLPLSGLGALFSANGVTFSGGLAHDVHATYDRHLRATLRLDGLAAHLGTATVDKIAGPLTIVGDGLGSGALDGMIEPAGAPLALSGEVHDVRDWTRGSRDLRMLGDMIARIAVQANVRWSNVEAVAPGVVYGQYAMTTKDVPHVVQLVAMDGHEPTLHFDTALADDHVISKGARTTDLGVRTNAVAGVNGDYFDIGRTYEPQGLLMRGGALVHGPTDHEALIFDRQNRPTFARFRLHGSVTDGSRTYPLTLFNSWPTREVAFITPDYGTTLPAAPGVTFAALQPLTGTRYRVTSLVPMLASIPTVLGLGFSDDLHEPLPRPGDVVDVQYALDPPVDGAVAGIGSGPLLLKDGQWYEDKHAPAPDERDVQWPVIAVGTFADGTIVFAAVDGRHPERSIGMTRPEFGELLREFGVVDAMALDSGGSVTMVARSPGAHAVTLHNVPSDNSAERYVSDALFAYSTAPPGTIVASPRPHVEPTPLGK